MVKEYSAGIEDYFRRIKSAIDAVSRREIGDFMGLLADALESGRTVFVMGNGGSGSTASHYACDFNKGLSFGKAKRFRFICLNDNMPTLLAYANDEGYEEVFVEQLRNLLTPRDLVIGISGSGNSPNVLKAIAYANSQGASTVGLTGFDGGELRRIARYGVNIPGDNMQVAEDLHLMLDHLIYTVFSEEARG